MVVRQVSRQEFKPEDEELPIQILPSNLVNGNSLQTMSDYYFCVSSMVYSPKSTKCTELNMFCTSTTAKSRAKIWYQ